MIERLVNDTEERAIRNSIDAVRAILDARAAALARVPATLPDAAETLELLLFNLTTEKYALEVALVREVHRQPQITPLPGTPRFVLGVTNLRGDVLAVLDLGELFSVSGSQRSTCPWLIVLGRERAEFGIVCDAVHEVRSLRIDAVQAASGVLEGVSREFARGVTSDALVVLDGLRIMNDARLYIDDHDEITR